MSGSSAWYQITFKQRIFETLCNASSGLECGSFAFDGILFSTFNIHFQILKKEAALKTEAAGTLNRIFFKLA